MYAATVGGTALTFEVMTVHRRNMIMRDRQTRTIWQHATGEGLSGPLQGSRLEPLGGEQMRWGTWLHDHPETTAMVETPETPQSVIPSHILPKMLWNIPARFVPPGRAGFDTRLPAHSEVVGVTIAGEARAYPLFLLQEQPVLEDVLGGACIRLEYDAAADRLRAYRQPVSSNSWEPLRADRQWWLAWSEFHPDTGIYGAR